jgi:hypothetical protein
MYCFKCGVRELATAIGILLIAGMISSISGNSATTAALSRSWQDLHLGMTPVQLERVCNKFGYGPATAEKDLESLDGLTDVELPVIKRCVPHGCEGVKVYACKGKPNISAVFSCHINMVLAGAMHLDRGSARFVC